MKYQFNTKTAREDLIEQAFCESYGYEEYFIDGTPNPESKKEFCERMIKQYFVAPYLSKKRMEALAQIENGNNGDV